MGQTILLTEQHQLVPEDLFHPVLPLHKMSLERMQLLQTSEYQFLMVVALHHKSTKPLLDYRIQHHQQGHQKGQGQIEAHLKLQFL
jgi:hypothetical protein